MPQDKKGYRDLPIIGRLKEEIPVQKIQSRSKQSLRPVARTPVQVSTPCMPPGTQLHDRTSPSGLKSHEVTITSSSLIHKSVLISK